MDVLLLHGYNVTSTQTYGLLPKRLQKAGHRIKDVYLGKYVTLDNTLTLPDLIRAFQAALEDLYGRKLGKTRFACLTHSTGALVARGWLSTFGSAKGRLVPISHLIMLAPPNHGSRLASLGLSRLSRLRSLWGVEPGVKILEALEPGSAYQWNLNSEWIEKNTTVSAGFFPFVIGGQWIDKKIWDVIVPATYERGSDGVIRAASANLNMKKIKVGAEGKMVQSEIAGVPFLLAPQTSHSDENGIMGSIPATGDHPVLTAILQALDVTDRKSHQSLSNSFAQQTTELQTTETYHDGSALHRYTQMVVAIKDNQGNPLSDYAIELMDSERRGDRFPSGFLSHGMQNSFSREHFIFYLDYDLVSQVEGGQLGFRVQSVPPSPLVGYSEFYFEGAPTKFDNMLAPNRTTYVEVTMRRRLNKNVFQLTKNLSYQKIERKAGPNWIE